METKKAVQPLFAIFFQTILSLLSLDAIQCTSATTVDDDVILHALKIKIEELGGFVHPSIKLVSPSPCCVRGIISSQSVTYESEDDEEKVWVSVPPTYHLSRSFAMNTLVPLIPPEVLEYAPLSTLDDGALLVLLLVHMKGIGLEEWEPYLASLPHTPGCGWYGDNNIIHEEYRDVAYEAKQYVSRVAKGMSSDYGNFLAKTYWPKEWIDSTEKAIEWALCIVSSRGTASSPEYGGGHIKLVPLVDMFNHSPHHQGFKELTTKDGSFQVRIDKDYSAGEEILVDYNLDYHPEEWFMSHGFVPQEAVEATNNRQEL